jgi:hypothetical protein
LAPPPPHHSFRKHYYEHPISAHAARAMIDHFVGEELRRVANECVPVLEGRDPFGIADECLSAGGHEPIASDGIFICHHCSRIIWR